MAEVWIGLAHVRPRQGNDLLEGELGAFVPSVGLAENEQEFASAVAWLLNKLEFDVVEVEDIETLTKRESSFSVDSQLLELASKLTPEYPVQIGKFHCYDKLEDSDEVEECDS
jgi:hypothetical protein